MFKGGVEISKTLTIMGHITDVSLDASEVVYTIVGDVNLQILNMLISIISSIIIIGVNALLSTGIYLPDFFPFLKPLELSEIDIYLSEYYLVVEALPKIDEKAILDSFLSSVQHHQSLSSEHNIGSKIQSMISEAIDTTTFEDAKPYLQHSSLGPVKPIYKILKMVENIVSMNDPDYKWEAGLDDL